MCISLPGRVVAVDAGRARVLAEGCTRSASLLVVPDVAVGDWVIVAAGAIVARLDPREAANIRAELDRAMKQRGAQPRDNGGHPS